MNKLSLAALAGARVAVAATTAGSSRSGDGYHHDGGGRLKSSKCLGLVSRDSRCDDGEEGKGDEGELIHVDLLLLLLLVCGFVFRMFLIL